MALRQHLMAPAQHKNKRFQNCRSNDQIEETWPWTSVLLENMVLNCKRNELSSGGHCLGHGFREKNDDEMVWRLCACCGPRDSPIKPAAQCSTASLLIDYWRRHLTVAALRCLWCMSWRSDFRKKYFFLVFKRISFSTNKNTPLKIVV